MKLAMLHSKRSPCCDAPVVGVQYQGTAEDWDGVSEWVCSRCGERRGRWTNKVLTGDDVEPRYGVIRASHS